MEKFRYITFFWLVIPLLIIPAGVWPQSNISGSLEEYIDAHIEGMPSGTGTEDYFEPDDLAQSIWKEVIQKVLEEDYSSASSLAGDVHYQLFEFTDTTSTPNRPYRVLQRDPQGDGNFWGIYVFDPAPARSGLVIQSPHPLNDWNTGNQGVYVFMQTEARAFFVSGAHRCNSPDYSDCSGTTSTCSSSSEKYRISDQPHVVTGMFQLTTGVMESSLTEMIVVQLHGFGKGADDPDLIMSNGTHVTPQNDHISTLRAEFEDIDSTLTFKIPHIDTSWTRLAGTTNVQGRLINGSADPCNTRPSSATGRFLHLEQAYDNLRDTRSSWDRVARAVAATFEEDLVAIQKTERENFEAAPVIQIHPNPFNTGTVFTLQFNNPTRAQLMIVGVNGNTLKTWEMSNFDRGNHQIRWDRRDFRGKLVATGVYILAVKTPNNIYSRKMVVLK